MERRNFIQQRIRLEACNYIRTSHLDEFVIFLNVMHWIDNANQELDQEELEDLIEEEVEMFYNSSFIKQLK